MRIVTLQQGYQFASNNFRPPKHVRSSSSPYEKTLCEYLAHSPCCFGWADNEQEICTECLLRAEELQILKDLHK